MKHIYLLTSGIRVEVSAPLVFNGNKGAGYNTLINPVKARLTFCDGSKEDIKNLNLQYDAIAGTWTEE